MTFDNRRMGSGDTRWFKPDLVTAQPTGPKGRRSAQREINIQSLASHPDLLPNRWKPTPTKSARSPHASDCECEDCEASGEDYNELNFDLD